MVSRITWKAGGEPEKAEAWKAIITKEAKHGRFRSRRS